MILMNTIISFKSSGPRSIAFSPAKFMFSGIVEVANEIACL